MRVKLKSASNQHQRPPKGNKAETNKIHPQAQKQDKQTTATPSPSNIQYTPDDIPLPDFIPTHSQQDNAKSAVIDVKQNTEQSNADIYSKNSNNVDIEDYTGYNSGGSDFDNTPTPTDNDVFTNNIGDTSLINSLTNENNVEHTEFIDANVSSDTDLTKYTDIDDIGDNQVVDEEYNDEDDEGEEAEDTPDEDEQEENIAQIFFKDHYMYSDACPRIPEQWRAADIIGKRTKPGGSTALRIGPIQPKAKLRQIWKDLTSVEKYIMMLISEHRHMTVQQLSVLIINPTICLNTDGWTNNCRTYWRWVSEEKYQCQLNYRRTFNTRQPKGLKRTLGKLCEAGLLEEITPSYGINETNVSQRVKSMPALYTNHYYLTVLGAKVLICNTAANRTTSTDRPVGFVPSYHDAAYMSILHESECTEVMCSIISCATYATNTDKGKYGLVDVCRFYHEKDTETRLRTLRNKKLTFKPDGKITLYAQSLDEFIDAYLEYDSGSSRESNIKHKIHAYYLHNIRMMEEHGMNFRLPLMLLISQKPSAYFPQLTGRKSTTYSTAIKHAILDNLEPYARHIDAYGAVYVTDCGSIREHGALGAVWHRVNIGTGIPESNGRDLLSAASTYTAERKQVLAAMQRAQTEATEKLLTEFGGNTR